MQHFFMKFREIVYSIFLLIIIFKLLKNYKRDLFKFLAVLY